VPIDDPNAAFAEQYFKDQEQSQVGLAVFVGRLALPKAALPLEVFQKVRERLLGVTLKERVKAMWDRLVQEMEYLERTKVSTEDVEEAIQIALRRDAEEFNDRKRDRYVKLIGNALRSDVEVRDLAVFVQTVEQLGEQDIAVLKILNGVMNKPDVGQQLQVFGAARLTCQ
jgi:hypothetical protein